MDLQEKQTQQQQSNHHQRKIRKGDGRSGISEVASAF
jgi:hypothetical protein